MEVKLKFNDINVKEEKEKTLVKVLMLKGEKGDSVSAEWGTITGTLNEQTDLKNALDSKANQSDLNTTNQNVSNLQSTKANQSALNTTNQNVSNVDAKVEKKPYYYDTLDDLKNDLSLKDGDCAITLGYYEINDGGEGIYSIVDDSTLTDDGGSIIDIENELKAKLIINDFVNVKQFGSKGNGTTDDTTKIQNAINYASNKKIKLLFEAKTYLVTQLNINNYIVIDGNNATLFRNPYNGNGSKNIFNINSNCIIKNFNFNSEQLYTPYIYIKAGETTEEVASNIYAFEIRNVNNLIIENLSINKMGIGLVHTSTNIKMKNIKTSDMEMGFYLQNVINSYFEKIEFNPTNLHKYYHDFYVVDGCDNVYFNDFTHINNADYSDVFHLYTESEIYADNGKLYFQNFKIVTTDIVLLAQCNSGECNLFNGEIYVKNNSSSSLLSVNKGNIIFNNCNIKLYGRHNDYVENAIFNNCKILIENIYTGYRLFVKCDFNNTDIDCQFDVNISNCNIKNSNFNGTNYRLYFNDGLSHEVKYNTFIGTFTSLYFVYNGNNQDFTNLRFLNNRVTNPRNLYDTNIATEQDVSFMYNILK